MKKKQLLLNQVYKTAATIEKGIDLEIPFIFETTKANLKVLRSKSQKFNRNTLLHDYIKSCFLFENDNYFYQSPDEVIEGVFDLDFLETQFELYKIDIEFIRIRFDENDYPITSTTTIYNWYTRNRNKFKKLATKISDDIFYILFSNRNLLADFNRVISANFKKFDFQKKELSTNGKIKRINIPSWVKTAVFHRDKGHCAICMKNISGTLSTLEKINFDHIVPLDLFGTNDPTNIQLLCESCNKEKLNRNTESGIIYDYWFD